jgi:hypothetical protein
LTNIIHSHQSNWDDGHQLMSTLFTSDECRQVYQAARAWLVTQAPPQTAKPELWADERILDTRPDWDPNTPTGLQSIQHMRQAILEGAHQEAQGATNLTRVSEVTQKPDELPSQFYDQLCNAYCRYTTFDPEAPKNRSMINTAFVQ